MTQAPYQTTLEIRNYAVYLGMNLDEDQEFIYIAKEGLTAPLPEPWKELISDEGEIYFVNTEAQTSQWEHPLDEVYRQKFREMKQARRQELKPIDSNARHKPPVSGGNNEKLLMAREQIKQVVSQQSPQVKKKHPEDYRNEKVSQLFTYEDQKSNWYNNELARLKKAHQNELASYSKDQIWSQPNSHSNINHAIKHKDDELRIVFQQEFDRFWNELRDNEQKLHEHIFQEESEKHLKATKWLHNELESSSQVKIHVRSPYYSLHSVCSRHGFL